MSSKESIQWMKELMPFKFRSLPRGVAAHDFDLFHRDFLERLRHKYEIDRKYVLEWFETPFIRGLFQMMFIEQRLHQNSWNYKISISSLIKQDGFDTVFDFLSIPLKGETFVLYSEYIKELDKDVFTKKYLKARYPILLKDGITTRYHFDEHALRISTKTKQEQHQYDLKKKLLVITGSRTSGMSIWNHQQYEIKIPYLAMVAVEDLKQMVPSDLIHMILQYAFGRRTDIEKYTFEQ